ncbi:MAG: hypothetical protein JWN38_412 [Candidatus Saccharibacteria bacterium]|nr:hypothetical protein [Candidatus Saccharibacteria bacterium]
MNSELIAILIAAAVIVLLIAIVVFKRRPRKVNVDSCTKRWQAVQKRCADKGTWPQAIAEADKLLDDVLKRRHYKGKTTGERLVTAQHDLTNNEGVWFGHKLRNRIEAESLKKVSKQDTLEALGGFRQALKDLGALSERKVVAETTDPVKIVAPGAPDVALVKPATKKVPRSATKRPVAAKAPAKPRKLPKGKIL